ncbi:MAG: glycosyltransferase family 39 protein [Nitrospirae bacterium]|nr:glycosyltransferase family 39 protein [Nitrospirota bacterium]
MVLDRKTAIFLSLIFLGGVYFYLYRLDSRILWEDEAITANLAVNILKYGIPVGDDGKNRLIVTTPDDLNSDSIWVFSPWLSEYITAGSFAIFGKGEVAARLPFAVLGFLSVIFLFYLVWDIFKDRQMALIALVLLVTSEVLILHSRQCRYYAIAVFMQVLLIFAFYQLLKRKRMGIVFIVIALTCQFYSNYVFVPGNMLLLLCAGFVFRKKYPGIFSDIIIAAVVVSALALVWVIYAHLWGQAMYIGRTSYLHKFLFYLMQINMAMFPLLLLVLLIYFRKSEFFIGTGIPRDMLYFLIAMIPFQIVFVINYSSFYIRYVIVLVPAFVVLQSLILRKSPPLLRYTALGLLCLTNLIGYAGLFPFKTIRAKVPNIELQMPKITLKDIIMERITPYFNRTEEVIAFLRENIRPGQTLLLSGYGTEFPVIFYTNIKVISVDFIRSRLTEMPDWIIPQSVSGINEYFSGKKFSIDIAAISGFLKDNYEMLTIDVAKSSAVGSVPEPDLYEYVTASEKTQFIAFKRKTQGEAEIRTR